MARSRTIVRVEGAAKLRATLKAAGDDFSDLKAAHARAAAVVTAAARGGAPVRSGRLAGSGRGSGTKAGAVVRFGSAGLPYAGVQEYGWPGHHIAAQPYLVPAAIETEPTWLPAYREEAQAILDKVKGV